MASRLVRSRPAPKSAAKPSRQVRLHDILRRLQPGDDSRLRAPGRTRRRVGFAARSTPAIEADRRPWRQGVGRRRCRSGRCIRGLAMPRPRRGPSARRSRSCRSGPPGRADARGGRCRHAVPPTPAHHCRSPCAARWLRGRAHGPHPALSSAKRGALLGPRSTCPSAYLGWEFWSPAVLRGGSGGLPRLNGLANAFDAFVPWRRFLLA